MVMVAVVAVVLRAGHWRGNPRKRRMGNKERRGQRQDIREGERRRKEETGYKKEKDDEDRGEI